MEKQYDNVDRLAIWKRVSKAGNDYYSGMADFKGIEYSVMAFEDQDNEGSFKLKAMPKAECPKCDNKWNTVEDSKGDNGGCKSCGAKLKVQWDNERQPKAKPYETLWGTVSPKELNGHHAYVGALTRKDWENDIDITVMDVVLFEVVSDNEKAPTYSGSTKEPYEATVAEEEQYEDVDTTNGFVEEDLDEDYDF